MAQHYDVSRLIGPKERADAGKSDLTFLSAFERKHWVGLSTGWERQEYDYRKEVKALRERQETVLNRDWPESKELLAAARRSAEFAHFREAWAAASEREQNRPAFDAPT